MLRTLTTRLATGLALVLSLGVAHADSFKTSAHMGSKRAARVSPAPLYDGTTLTNGRAKTVARAGVALIRSTPNAAVRMDTIRQIDSATMIYPAIRGAVTRALHALAQSGAPIDRFTSGYHHLMRTESPTALADVRAGARALPGDSAVQLGAFQAVADHAYGLRKPTGNQQSRLYAEAGRYLGRAEKIEQTGNRPLVKRGIADTRAYLGYYPELTRFVK